LPFALFLRSQYIGVRGFLTALRRVKLRAGLINREGNDMATSKRIAGKGA
jgi:hypothetical protein